MRAKIVPVAFALLALISCGRSGQTPASHPVQVIETAWTSAAADRAESLMEQRKLQYVLPEVRVYDTHRNLIFHQLSDKPSIVGALDRTIAADRPIAGPTFAETVGDLETGDHHPAADRLAGSAETTIVDYWASWCVPCKALEKKLMAWAAKQPEGSVRIVKAEADLMKAAAARGIKVERFKQVKGPDGKLHLVHVA